MKRKQKGESRGASQRQLRVGELFRQSLCEVFARDDVRGLTIDTRLITVTEVTTSPDLRNATAYIMPLGGEKLESCVKALNDVAPHLRAQMSKGLRLKFVPQLTFKPDLSFENADQMRALLKRDEVVRDLDALDEVEAESDDIDDDIDNGSA